MPTMSATAGIFTPGNAGSENGRRWRSPGWTTGWNCSTASVAASLAVSFGQRKPRALKNSFVSCFPKPNSDALRSVQNLKSLRCKGFELSGGVADPPPESHRQRASKPITLPTHNEDPLSKRAEFESARTTRAGDLRAHHLGGNRGQGARAGSQSRGRGGVSPVECRRRVGNLDPTGQGSF